MLALVTAVSVATRCRYRRDADTAGWNANAQAMGPAVQPMPISACVGTRLTPWGKSGLRQAGACPHWKRPSSTRANEEYVRGTEAWALGRMGAAAAAAKPVLVKMLASGHVSVRRNASEALGRFGPAAKIAVPALLKLRRRRVPVVRVNANVALWKIHATPRPCPPWYKCCGRAKNPAAYHAAEVLGGAGRRARPSAPPLPRGGAGAGGDLGQRRCRPAPLAARSRDRWARGRARLGKGSPPRRCRRVPHARWKPWAE